MLTALCDDATAIYCHPLASSNVSIVLACSKLKFARVLPQPLCHQAVQHLQTALAVPQPR